ncbi:cyclic nucleotide-binding domain-containing protein [Streptantibioticus ferralitis]|uniref:Cyclic nucleotide-binding domain-containing protein n=1 Tax=Streptantibioticus ferralitis TaxID=236510 RepID=A0ABT5Z119_9ACTN|nr:cyclic nucleotide-binding domain-containing protein [Streptantibioticus ferralitis]MDF2257489.1 cyclic nucleotide-binding domain-containing protein [Streptantibioticus ferralitis]
MTGRSPSLGPAFLRGIPAAKQKTLMELSHEVTFASGHRIFHEGGKADRFWVLRSGRVALDLHVPGRRAADVELLESEDLLGWSWLFAPYVWHLGARALTEVHADEFDAEAVRALCAGDSELGQAVAMAVAAVIGHRLVAARTRLLDLFAPYGSGERG